MAKELIEAEPFEMKPFEHLLGDRASEAGGALRLLDGHNQAQFTPSFITPRNAALIGEGGLSVATLGRVSLGPLDAPPVDGADAPRPASARFAAARGVAGRCHRARRLGLSGSSRAYRPSPGSGSPAAACPGFAAALAPSLRPKRVVSFALSPAV